MDTQLNEDSLSVAQYLAGERVSEIRHEYINGRVHAMVGASDRHNLIALNIATLLLSKARARGCQVFISDMKVYLNIGGEDILYYPDVMVACDPDDREPYFRRNPCLVVEVLSPATERIDRREKFLAYTTLPSLKEYLLVCQDQPRVTLFQRRDNWQAHIFGPGSRLELDCLEGAIEVDAVYETLDFNEG